MLLAVWGFEAVEITKVDAGGRLVVQEVTKVMSALSIPALCSLGPGRLPHSPALLTKTGSRQGSRSCASPLTGSEGRSESEILVGNPEVLTG